MNTKRRALKERTDKGSLIDVLLACGAAFAPGGILSAPVPTQPRIVCPALPESLRWQATGPLLSPAPADGQVWHAIKDPSIVWHEDAWHLFGTVRGTEHSHAIVYLSFHDWDQAEQATRHILTCHSGYFCAPQIFQFSPTRLWYLICQAADRSWSPNYQPAFTTTTNIANPNSWPPLKPMFEGHAEPPKAWLDFWVICDSSKAHLFFTSLDGKVWRCETALDHFPLGWSSPTLALEGDVFEASHTYKLARLDQYLTVIEAQNDNGSRYYKAYLADRLEGPWRPWLAERERPFASPLNVLQASPRWTDSISHGELIRTGSDEHLEIEPDRFRFLIQGVLEADRQGLPYGQIPWRLGLLEQR